MERVILHSDLNNFFASVEATKNPLLRGKCFAVAGDPHKRHGIILAKSQEAKKFGILTGETIWEAKLKCPQLLLVPPDMIAYHHYSKAVQQIYRRYTDEIENFGIDEAWLDVTASRRLFGSGADIAEQIKEQIKSELHLTVSIGVSFNKIFAKLGSDLKKPDAITVISKENFKSIVYPLPISALLFVGKSTCEKLYRYGLRTVEHLAQADPFLLKKILGVNGVALHEYALGHCPDHSLLMQQPPVKSVGNSVTPHQDLCTFDEIWIQILLLAEHIAGRLRKKGLSGTLISIYVRNSQFLSGTRQRSIPLPTSTASVIAQTAFSLFCENYDLSVPVRCLGISVSKLQHDNGHIQLSFFESNQNRIRNQQLDDAVDRLRNHYGFDCVSRARCIRKHLKNYTIPTDPSHPDTLCTLPGCRL